MLLLLPLPGIPTTKKKNNRSTREMRQHGFHLRILEDAVGAFSPVLAGAGSERVLGPSRVGLAGGCAYRKLRLIFQTFPHASCNNVTCGVFINEPRCSRRTWMLLILGPFARDYIFGRHKCIR